MIIRELIIGFLVGMFIGGCEMSICELIIIFLVGIVIILLSSVKT
jgi:hypothetical protein